LPKKQLAKIKDKKIEFKKNVKKLAKNRKKKSAWKTNKKD